MVSGVFSSCVCESFATAVCCYDVPAAVMVVSKFCVVACGIGRRRKDTHWSTTQIFKLALVLSLQAQVSPAFIFNSVINIISGGQSR